MVDALDLLLHYRHSPGKIVVFPYLSCQLPQLLVRHRLSCAQGVFPPPFRQEVAEHVIKCLQLRNT